MRTLLHLSHQLENKQTKKKLKRKNCEFSNGMLTATKIFEITNVSRYLDLLFVCLAVNEWLL